MEKSTNITDFDQNLAITPKRQKPSLYYFGNTPNRIEKDRYSPQFVQPKKEKGKTLQTKYLN